VAHPLPRAARDSLQQQLAPYRARFAAARWTQPASWHLTLVFLGSVEPARRDQLSGLLEAVGEQASPYRVRLDAGGGRVRRGEGVAWLGLSAGAGRLIELAAAVADGCPADSTSGAPPKRTPSAHLTVARKADDALVRALRDHALGAIATSWTVDRLQLVRSHLEPTGARYETLYEVTL
jgi:2'-5' RNA ligase